MSKVKQKSIFGFFKKNAVLQSDQDVIEDQHLENVTVTESDDGPGVTVQPRSPSSSTRSEDSHTHSDSHSDSEVLVCPPPKKKKKVSFQESWKQVYSWVENHKDGMRYAICVHHNKNNNLTKLFTAFLTLFLSG